MNFALKHIAHLFFLMQLFMNTPNIEKLFRQFQLAVDKIMLYVDRNTAKEIKGY